MEGKNKQYLLSTIVEYLTHKDQVPSPQSITTATLCLFRSILLPTTDKITTYVDQYHVSFTKSLPFPHFKCFHHVTGNSKSTYTNQMDKSKTSTRLKVWQDIKLFIGQLNQLAIAKLSVL